MSSSSSKPTITSLSQRLTSLSSLILERSRVLSLNLPSSASTDTQIIRGLKNIRDGLERIADEVELESGGLSVGGGPGQGMGSRGGRISFSGGGGGKEIDKLALKGLGERYDRVIGMMEADDVGRTKVAGLKRRVRESVRYDLSTERGVCSQSLSFSVPFTHPPCRPHCLRLSLFMQTRIHPNRLNIHLPLPPTLLLSISCIIFESSQSKHHQ